jgi:predicted transcriptional regulator
MATALEQEWLSYFVQLNEREKKSVLQTLKNFLQKKEQLQAQIDIAQYNQEINKALAEIAAGNFITQEELEKQAAEW